MHNAESGELEWVQVECHASDDVPIEDAASFSDPESALNFIAELQEDGQLGAEAAVDALDTLLAAAIGNKPEEEDGVSSEVGLLT